MHHPSAEKKGGHIKWGMPESGDRHRGTAAGEEIRVERARRDTRAHALASLPIPRGGFARIVAVHGDILLGL